MPSDPLRPAGPAASRAAARQSTSARALEDALAPFEEGLRLHLPSADDILRAAAQRNRGAARRKQAAVLALAAAAVGLAWLDPAYRTETLATAVGERATWELPDGSQVALNSASRVSVALHLRSRRLVLERGEALFEVAHAPVRALERPFSVRAPGLVVHDIGTVFNVRSRAAGVDVSVLQGRVRVEADGGASRELGAGQSLSTAGGGSLVTDEGGGAVRDPRAEWRQGRLVLDGTPLREVVEEIRRYRAGAIEIQPGAVGDIRMSGQFDLDHLDQLIDLLPTLTPVDVLRRGDGSIRIEARARR